MAGGFDSEQSDRNSVTGGDRERGRRPAKGRIVIRTIAGFARRAKTHVISFCALAWPGAALGSIVAFMAFNSYAALCARTGLGSAADVAIGTVFGLVAIDHGCIRAVKHSLYALCHLAHLGF